LVENLLAQGGHAILLHSVPNAANTSKNYFTFLLAQSAYKVKKDCGIRAENA
jgi:hypothetical protein